MECSEGLLRESENPMLNYLEVCRTWFVDWNKNEFGHVGKTIEKLHLNIGLSYTEQLLILLRTFKT